MKHHIEGFVEMNLYEINVENSLAVCVCVSYFIDI